jgi:PAS domain S-box-containing protein
MDALHLDDFFENAAMAMHWIGPDGTILRANRAELELLGYESAEYVGRNAAEFHAEPRALAEALRRLAEGETLHEYPAVLRCKDGSFKQVRITANVHRRNGRFIHTRGFTRDVTEQVDYLEGLMEGFVAYDAGWVMTYMNAAAERILGRRREDVLGKTWHQAFPHAVGNPVDHMYQRVMRTRSAERMEYHYAHYGRWMEISASPVRSGGVAVYFRDISDRETLNRIGRTLASELDLDRVVQAVTDAATEVTGAKFGAFFYNVKDAAGESYTLYTLSGVARDAFAAFPMPRNTAVFAPTFTGEGIVRSEDITADPRYGKNAPYRGMPQGHLPVRSYLAVPVVARSGEVLGGLFFGHPDRGVFDERAERLVANIAAQAAIAIDNARLYRSLQESEGRYRAVLESQSEMVCRFRLDGTILFVNAAYARSGGLTPEAMLGRSFWDFIPAADHEGVRAMLAHLTPQAPEIKIENRFQTQDGERWTLWLNRAIAFDAEGRVVEAQSTGIDITERRRAEERMREADRRKDEFLAMLAHELRNPLAPIRTGLDLLRAAPQAQATAEVRAVMERQLRHLVRLVDDLLEVSRISSGKIALKREAVDLHAVVAAALEASRQGLEAAHHTLEVALPAERVSIDADFVRVAQVISNLLNNAAKYTNAQGRVVLEARREGEKAVITVRDNGIGIAPELLPRVFEMFTQADRARSGAGLGVGLALVKRLVELHGGTVEAASEGLGKGAAFTVRLPLASS